MLMGGDTEKRKSNILMIVLGVLCCVMVVLIGVVVFNVTRTTEEEVVEQNTPEIDSSTVVVDEEVQKTIDELENARDEAKEILARDSVSAQDIIDFYALYINKYIELNEPDRTASYVWARMDDLLAKGFKKEALDVLLEMDLKVVGDGDEYRQYANIVALARDLGMNDVADQYMALLNAAGRGEDSVNTAAERIEGIEKEGVGSRI